MDNITTIFGKFSSVLELKEYADKQFVAFKQAVERVQQLEKEVDHLKGLLANKTPILGVVSSEIAICDMQINFLKQESMNRPLTLEETKRLDLLVKNKILYTEHEQAKYKPKEDDGDVDMATLLTIVSNPEETNG